MLLKEITLKDFRQYIGVQKMSFSEKEDKNITIVIGENGTGKTTFSQAFTWCLYGDTDFSDKNLLCKSTAQKMTPNTEEKVYVELKFNHDTKAYVCKREQIYYKDSSGILKSKNNCNFAISYKGKDGQEEWINSNKLESTIKNILPNELSSYFFFDGERIKDMGKAISSGYSKEFPEAVKRLLGLSAFEKALYHLNDSHNQNSVYKLYNKQIDASGNEELKNILARIEDENNKKNIKEEEQKKVVTDITSLERQINELLEKQKTFANVESKIERRESLQKEINEKEKILNLSKSQLLKRFSGSSYNFFTRKMINDSVDLLGKADVKDKGIPYIHQKTIDYLIKQGKCICGNCIQKNTAEYNSLIELLKFIPPQSLGTSIKQFINTAKEKTKSNKDFFDEYMDTYSIIRDEEEELNTKLDEISIINKELSNSSKDEIKEIQNRISFYQKAKDDLLVSKGSLENEISQLKQSIAELETNKGKYINTGNTNKKIGIYLAYTKQVYDELHKEYLTQEDKIRNEFETTINQIFKQIYEGGLSLKIDNKYNIQIIVNDFKGYSEGVETSTAQSLSVILAFISSIIKMARESKVAGNKLLVTESYPLVMDAPLSAFDKTRIQTICEVLPSIAEQVIIFINDKDGEIAKENMKDKIGKIYSFNKENEFETYVEEEKLNV